MSYHFYAEEEINELYHLTPAEMHTLLDYYFKARAYDALLTEARKDKAMQEYKDGYAREVGEKDTSTYTWEDMVSHELFSFECW